MESQTDSNWTNNRGWDIGRKILTNKGKEIVVTGEPDRVDGGMYCFLKSYPIKYSDGTTGWRIPEVGDKPIQ